MLTAMATLEQQKKQINQDWELIYNKDSGILPAMKAVLSLHMPQCGLHKIIDQLAAFFLPFHKVCEGSVPVHRQMSVEQIIHAIYINVKASMENGMIVKNKADSVRKLRLSLFKLLQLTKAVYHDTQVVPPPHLAGGGDTPYILTKISRSTYVLADARTARVSQTGAAGAAGAAEGTHVFPMSSYCVAQAQPSIGHDRGDDDMSDLLTELDLEAKTRAKHCNDRGARNVCTTPCCASGRIRALSMDFSSTIHPPRRCTWSISDTSGKKNGLNFNRNTRAMLLEECRFGECTNTVIGMAWTRAWTMAPDTINPNPDANELQRSTRRNQVVRK